MSLKPKSRSRSKISTTTAENGQPIDKKTKQLLFYECEIGLVSRTVLKPNESFSQQRANELLQKNSRKKAAKCMAYFLIDRIRFQKKGGGIGSGPFRKEITYREMKHFYVFPNYPDVFMLCVADEKKNKRSYELYRCTTAENVNIICDLTYRASTDKQNILHDVLAVRQISMFSRASTNEPSVVDYEYSPENSPNESKRESEYERKLSNEHTNNVTSYYNEPQMQDTGRTNGTFTNYSGEPRRHSKPSPKTNGVSHDNHDNVRPLYTCYDDVPTHETDLSMAHGDQYIYAKPQNKILTDQRQLSNYSVNQGTSPDIFRKSIKSNYTSNYLENDSPPYNYTPVIIPKAQVWNQERTPDRWNNSHHNQGGISSPDLKTGSINSIVIEKRASEENSAQIKKAISNLDLRFGDDITYLNFDPVSGTHITDTGPMYMYITRYETVPAKIDRSPNVSKTILYHGQ